jgi:hypothetical protein
MKIDIRLCDEHSNITQIIHLMIGWFQQLDNIHKT